VIAGAVVVVTVVGSGEVDAGGGRRPGPCREPEDDGDDVCDDEDDAPEEVLCLELEEERDAEDDPCLDDLG
jgi:hypothetical protein